MFSQRTSPSLRALAAVHRRVRSPLRVGIAVIAGAMGLACSDSPTGTGNVSRIVLTSTGRLERGLTIQVLAKRDSTTIPPSQLTFAAVPATSAQANSDGSIKLLAAGHVSVIATSGSESDTLGLDVAAPPTILVDRIAGGGVRAIYRLSLDGLDTVRLSSGIHDDVTPSTARDTVVFTSFRDGNAELYSVALGGGAEKRLTNSVASETSPALSPTAPKILYVNGATGFDRIWISASDGTGAVPAVTALATDVQESPRWSPVGDRFVFVSTALGSAALFVGTPGTGAAMPLILGGPSAVDPAWSFDAQTIAFISPRSDAPGPGLYSFSLADKGTTKLLTSGTDIGQPAYLRDGRIVFTRFVGNTSRLQWLDPADPATIYDIPLTGSPAHAVAP